MSAAPLPSLPGGDIAAEIALAARVSHFLTRETDLLDRWRLEDWLTLFAPTGRYVIAPLDDGALDEGNALFLAVDDRSRLEARVRQITGGFAWTEKPRSRTRRLICNVVADALPDGSVRARANGMVHQFRNLEACVFVAAFEYRLQPHGDAFLIGEKVVRLGHESLADQRRISILL